MNRYLLAFLMLCTTTAYAETHRWIDEHGKVHYSDQPPVGMDATALRAAPAPGSAPAPAKTYGERAAEMKKAEQSKKEADDLAAKKQADAALKESNCTLSRQVLIALQTEGPIVTSDEKGEQRFIADNERQQRMTKAQEDVGKWCK